MVAREARVGDFPAVVVASATRGIQLPVSGVRWMASDLQATDSMSTTGVLSDAKHGLPLRWCSRVLGAARRHRWQSAARRAERNSAGDAGTRCVAEDPCALSAACFTLGLEIPTREEAAGLGAPCQCPYAAGMLMELFAGISAFGALVTSGAVVVGVRQLHAAERQLEVVQEQARTAFEDDLSREYRAIVGELPADAFYTDGRTELTEATRRAFYRYFDLSNEQLFHIRKDRVSSSTGDQWRDGIRGNLAIGAFRAAWDDLEPHLSDEFFEDLRDVVHEVRAAASKSATPRRPLL